MGIGSGALIGMTALGAAGSVAGAAISSNAAGNAASTQAQAADESAQLQYELGEQSLGFQEGVYNQEQQNAQPWLQTGGSAELEMAQLLGLPSASNGATPAAPFSGTSPTFSSSGGTTQLPSYQNAVNGSTLNMSSLTNGGNNPLQQNPPTTIPGVNDRAVTGGVQDARNMPGSGGGGPILSSPGGSGNGNGAGGPVFKTTGTGPLLGPSPNGGVQPNQPLPGQTGQSGQAGAPGTPGSTTGQLQPFAPWTTPFTAPTAAQAAATPGEQFMLQQGEQAINNNASASGTIGNTGTDRALMNYGENLASTDYQQVYNNALQQYQQSYNVYQNNQANQWNRLASLAGMGQVSAGQLNSAGQSASGNVANILGTTGAQVGQNINNAAAANASGYIGQANSYGGALSNLSNLGSTLSLASLLNNQNSPGGTGNVATFSGA
jgi:hypothetical protein